MSCFRSARIPPETFTRSIFASVHGKAKSAMIKSQRHRSLLRQVRDSDVLSPGTPREYPVWTPFRHVPLQRQRMAGRSKSDPFGLPGSRSLLTSARRTG